VSVDRIHAADEPCDRSARSTARRPRLKARARLQAPCPHPWPNPRHADEPHYGSEPARKQLKFIWLDNVDDALAAAFDAPISARSEKGVARIARRAPCGAAFDEPFAPNLAGYIDELTHGCLVWFATKPIL
jgi:hypothetical protein